MDAFEDYLVSHLPLVVVIVIAIIVMWLRLGDLKKSVDDLKDTCKERLKWCVNHFQPKP